MNKLDTLLEVTEITLHLYFKQLSCTRKYNVT